MSLVHHEPEGTASSGPYSPAIGIRSDGLRLLQVSGQGTRDPVTGQRVLGDIGLQARAAMGNLRTVVEGSGFAMGDIVKVTIYLVNIGDLEIVDRVYASSFGGSVFPARSTVAIGGLPGGQGIEIDAVAIKKD